MEDDVEALLRQLGSLHLGFGSRPARSSIFEVKKVDDVSGLRNAVRPTKAYGGSFFSLPGEIRNRIVEFALVPGDIYLPAAACCKVEGAECTCERGNYNCRIMSDLYMTQIQGPLYCSRDRSINGYQLKTDPEAHLPSPTSSQPLTVPITRFMTASSPQATVTSMGSGGSAATGFPTMQCVPKWPSCRELKPIESKRQSRKLANLWFQRKAKGCWQLLATCKQAYREGHHFLYGNNIIHLAPGDLRNTLPRINAIEELNARLGSGYGIISHWCVDISLADLDSAVLSYVNVIWDILCRFHAIPHSGAQEMLRWTIMWALHNIWASKLAYLRSRCLQYPQQVTIRCNLPYVLCPEPDFHSFDELIIKADDTLQAFANLRPVQTLFATKRLRRGISIDYGHGSWKTIDKEIALFFQLALMRLEGILKRSLPNVGLRSFDPWTMCLAGDSEDRFKATHISASKVWGTDKSDNYLEHGSVEPQDG